MNGELSFPEVRYVLASRRQSGGLVSKDSWGVGS